MPTSSSHNSSFVEFPSERSIVHRLRAIDTYEPTLDSLFANIAERLSQRAYDRSAFVFILLEQIYEFEEDASRGSDLLGRLVYALTDDLELVGVSIEAYEEIQECLLLPPGEEADTAERAFSQPPEDDKITREVQLWSTAPDHEYLMLELQLAQKRVTDSGLQTRASIEMTLARPEPENVKQTLREISSLRSRLRRFEERLLDSEEKILAAIGVLD